MILPNNINDVKIIINLKLRKYDNLFKPIIKGNINYTELN